MLKSLFKKRLSRDFSEIFEGELEITIEGIGTAKYVFDCDTLGGCVAFVQCMLATKMVFINDIRQAPWEIISFDRAAKKLIVRPVQ